MAEDYAVYLGNGTWRVWGIMRSGRPYGFYGVEVDEARAFHPKADYYYLDNGKLVVVVEIRE